MTELSKSSGRSVLALATEACRSAIEDAGIARSEVDGVMSFSFNNDSVPSQAVATSLALPQPNILLDIGLGGQAPSYLVMHAAAMIEAGLARNIVIYRALNGRSGARVGTARVPGAATEFRYPIGLSAYPQFIAMWARRYLIETGVDEAALAAVTIAQSKWAIDNPRAIRQRMITDDDYWASPMVTDPFRVVDCTSEVDGGCAVLVTSTDRAADSRHGGVVIQGAAYVAGKGSGLDAGDAMEWPDMSRNYTGMLADDLWGGAGVSPQDLDLAEIYDCFSSSVLFALDGLGITERGGAGEFVASGATAPSGSLPINTNGGLLHEGYLHGMNTVAEAVLQLQGRGGDRQVADARLAAVTSGALTDGSALVLERQKG